MESNSNQNDRGERWSKSFRSNSYFSRGDNMDLDDELMNNEDTNVSSMNNGKNDAIQSIEYKENGNQCLKINQVDVAIEWYTKSLNLVPDNPKVLCNRAQAYKKIGNFSLMYDDSQAAIENDDTNYKGYIKNGEACLELCKSSKILNLDLCEKGLKRL